MAAAAGRIDELVKDYLLFRGLTQTQKAFDSELKNDKEKGLRVDKIIDQLQACITNYDMLSLKDYWVYLNRRLFARLEQRYMTSVRKLEVGLLKLYIINAAQTNKPDKVVEFFEKMTPELQNQPEFREWFAFPFLQSPQENPLFSMYFTKQWQDTLILSLHNFLSVILQAMPVPTLLSFEHEFRRMKLLQEENAMLKHKVMLMSQQAEAEQQQKEQDMPSEILTSASDLIYDFSGLSEDTTIQEKQQKTRRFPLHLTSPLIGRRKTEVILTKADPKPTKIVSKVTHPITQPPKPSLRRVSQSVASSAPQTGFQMAGGPVAMTTPEIVAPPRNRINAGEYEKQRKELLGFDPKKSNEKKAEVKPYVPEDPPPSSTPTSANTQTAPPFGGARRPHPTPPVSPAKTISSEPEKVKSVDMPDTASVGSLEGVANIPEGDCPFLLLSQDEYAEHHSAISYGKFSVSGQYIASLDADGVVKVWTWSPQPATTATVMSKSAFLSLEWASKSDRWLLLGNRTGNIRLFDVKEIKTFREVQADQSYPRIINITANPVGMSFVCSATVQRLRSGSTDTSVMAKPGKLMLWDLRTMKMDKQLPLEPTPVAINCCQYNHNGQLLMTGAADGRIRIFDIQQQKCITQWPAHDGEVHSVQFSSDETSCFSMGGDGKFIQWNIHKTGTIVRELAIHQGAALPFLATSPTGNKEVPRGRLFAFDPEGQYILTCDKNKGVLYQTREADPGIAKMMELQGHKSAVTTVDWSPSVDTRVCLMGAMDGKIKVSTLLSQ
ncbi:WD repeat-containing protein 91-like isoform X1 [Haliotis cracherodii]|uniref:WD repeat-containing protein 91-like isoform X1 n=2 Tax=Haliotis cracherodii TaxID=6455 RepID=UPI0039E781DB